MNQFHLIFIAITASLLAGTSLGCGLLSQAKSMAQTASVLSDFAERLGKSEKLTYTAEYQVKDGDKVTLVQQPPAAAYIAGKSRVIFTADHTYRCSGVGKAMACQKSPSQVKTASATEAGMITSVAGQAFVTPEMALGLVAAAALMPGANVTESEQTIAGQSSLCAEVTGLEAVATPGDDANLEDFTVCVTDDGILASFSGRLDNGEQGGVELVKYSATADPTLLAPPADATIVVVDSFNGGSTPR